MIIELKQSKQQRIVDAIINKRVVNIFYSGDESVQAGWRNVEPYLLGITLAGNLAIRAFQRQGVSLSDNKPDWRIYRLDRITKLEFIQSRLRRSAKPLYRSSGDDKFRSIIIQSPN